MASAPAILVTTGTHVCAAPLDIVTETMRPRPIEKIAGTPVFVAGLSVIRGAAVPVVDLHALVTGTRRDTYGRFVTLRIEGRTIALAVESVIGVRTLDRLDELPPLLRNVSGDVIEAIGTRDASLLLLLKMARVVPDDVWARLDAAEAR